VVLWIRYVIYCFTLRADTDHSFRWFREDGIDVSIEAISVRLTLPFAYIVVL
jgi:hypothetical protein